MQTPNPIGYPREVPYARALREAVRLRPQPHWSYDSTRVLRRSREARKETSVADAVALFEAFLANARAVENALDKRRKAAIL